MPANRRKPWFHAKRNTWKVTIDGRQVNLQTDDKDAAYDAWHKLLAKQAESPTARPTVDGALSVDELVTLFLEDIHGGATTTYTWYSRYLNSFRKSLPAGMAADSVRRKHVMDWIKRQGYDTPSQRGAIAAIKRAYNWSVEHEYLVASPLGQIKKPAARRRDTLLTAEQVTLILESSTPEFRDLIAVAMETGIRPQEIRIATAKHVDREQGTLEFVVKDNKTGKATGERRTVYLTDNALAIVDRLAAKHPTGALFRNSRGEAWTKDAIVQRMDTLRKKHPGLPKNLCLYNVRHTYATDALVAGVNPEELRILLGHSSMDMIVKHYSHLAKKKEHMRGAAKRARGGQ